MRNATLVKLIKTFYFGGFMDKNVFKILEETRPPVYLSRHKIFQKKITLERFFSFKTIDNPK